MPDVYVTLADVDRAIPRADLVDVLELRAADPQQRAMLESYLSRDRVPYLRSCARRRLWDARGDTGAGPAA